MVIDAQMISNFIKEFGDDSNDLTILINEITLKIGIVLDDIIEQEWRNTAGNQIFEIWFSQCIAENQIKYIERSIVEIQYLKKLVTKYGFPKKKSRDIHYIKCANCTDVRYILTDDIDFYDPKHKESSYKVKEMIKTNRNGQLNNYLRRKLRIIVGRIEHCRNDFSCLT